MNLVQRHLCLQFYNFESFLMFYYDIFLKSKLLSVADCNLQNLVGRQALVYILQKNIIYARGHISGINFLPTQFWGKILLKMT